MRLTLASAERQEDRQTEAVIEEVLDLLARAVVEDVLERYGRFPSGMEPCEEGDR